MPGTPHDFGRLRTLARFLRPLARFSSDRRVLTILILIAVLVAGRAWLAEHPGSNPWAPLDLREEPGWATRTKIAALREDPAQCRAVLERSEVAFTTLDPVGEDACRRENRILLSDFPYAGDRPDTSCAVAAALDVWRRDSVQPLAQEIFGQEVARIEHFGSFSCRRLYGRDEGPWSQHATGNAIDIAGFVLADGTRIAVVNDWQGEGEKARFLREVRDGACRAFGTVLSPDYNEAHRDHFHLDQEARGLGGVCR
ncbi:MAG: extensin [Citromicrobium sp.]|nr:extensin [Citromicrobium sp.]MAO96324.1 extensin [Citromicrobium sp.]MBT46966.1 extensin [Citromicrobium sp.]|tara:strand:+ start:350 stop:1114 length:765 start_codon:yes stop_codon:yes gene_type:complete